MTHDLYAAGTHTNAPKARAAFVHKVRHPLNADDLDAETRCRGKLQVASDQRCLEMSSEHDVERIVHREVSPKCPRLGEHREDLYPLDGRRDQPIESSRRTLGSDHAGEFGPPHHARDLGEVDLRDPFHRVVRQQPVERLAYRRSQEHLDAG